MSANTTEAIDGLTTAMLGIGDTFLLITLILIPVILTLVMFYSRSMMLGFPSAIFWFILGGYCYQQSTATWDINYFLFFASFSMGIFSMLAMYALRTKKEEAEEGDLYFDEGADKDIRYIDEEDGSGKDTTDEDGEKPSVRVKALRDRAGKRRSRYGSA